MKRVAVCISTAYVLLNVFYFANLIPPVPLALKSAGIYHNVRKTSHGYEVQHVRPPRWKFWSNSDDPFYLSPGEPAYCYTAIFAPGGIRVPVRHVWRRREASGDWITTDRIVFEISGGREGGYRGFTRKRLLTTGEWRVEVETEQGAILGRVDFTVSDCPLPHRHPPLETRTLN
jgi:hypothetical protein